MHEISHRWTIAALAAVWLAGCGGSTVRITSGKAQTVQTGSRSEPVFYNGKTYHLDFSYRTAASLFDMRVSGMGPKQQTDAVALATSSLGHFACPDSQNGRLIGNPAYAGGAWTLQARCA